MASAGTTTRFPIVRHPSRSSHRGPPVGTAVSVSSPQSSAFCTQGAQRRAARAFEDHELLEGQVRDGDRERPVGPTNMHATEVRLCAAVSSVIRGQRCILVESECVPGVAVASAAASVRTLYLRCHLGLF